VAYASPLTEIALVRGRGLNAYAGSHGMMAKVLTLIVKNLKNGIEALIKLLPEKEYWFFR
jgi:hypothetical protein